MDLQTVWFVLVAVLFAGYFVLEGFDFGVGMILPWLKKEERTAAIKTIGPVWDGNEVWLITAGGALFAAFPEWYATLFSGFYLPLFLILFGLIVRGIGLEWRSKVETQNWRDWCDRGIVVGSWLAALLWGVAFGNIVKGVAIDGNRQIESGFDGFIGLLNPFGLLGGATFVLAFLIHGLLFLGLKSGEPLRTRAHDIAKKLIVPAIVVAGGFLVWTQLAHGRALTWLPLGILVLCALAAAFALFKGRDGWAFAAWAVVILMCAAQLFGTLFPNLMPTTLADGVSLDIYNSSSSPYTLKVMTWAAGFLTPLVLLYQGWTYWVFRKRVSV
ncbi:Cytochrome bd-I ubiquinol oxidase subunit 2 [Corynebacterium kalinowskii]|uniref:Cytochrome bd-I ubiquinol oxidase subunit 2 n=1 Tax=Corynebacterium kalinowskii TaxID=2675216 RepID=A0A6B8VQP4_9CORY|nr:cytochrome d ubiquinol oxidase subunit II [Corynebacterium kalinowskii]QGU01335.1 Cytochrome bd-I ubiquinol oxidase subunit 2 [Corynebacterium kalinowskii]